MTQAGSSETRVLAVLGPTNTGKTHFAVERMLAHSSGMMGFPLRLLAREVFDRIVKLKGPKQVALVTGEEKLGPDEAPYVVATVEAMPIGRRFMFLGVDEIQLCADRERGHVFTDRLLRARGSAETVFLGSDTIRPLLKKLIPEAEVITRPRFSTLTHTGPTKLHRLPRRSAVVAFTAADVYALAEVMRRQKGGAAVVMGALSPRTRNAQVEMFQSGEVEHLVATDAIGMGLNMDLAHVAFAQNRKFDGLEWRGLGPPEVGQIAGRAGRHMSDGTFGTTNGCDPLDERTVEAVEGHTFAPLKKLRWRNAALDFANVDALMATLDEPPPHPGLVKVRDALDDRSLGVLSRRKDVRERATSERRVRLLWQVCQIPDFRKTLNDAHLGLLGTVFKQLTEGRARLSPDWLGRMLARLERFDGDIDALVSRIAHVRTLTYLSHRKEWLDDPDHWQERAREVEDRLSDALHERLTQKFVDRRTAALMRSLREKGDLPAVVEDGEVVVDGEKVGALQGLSFTLDVGASGAGGPDVRLFAGAARQAAARELARIANELANSPDAAFDLRGRDVTWRGETVATLEPEPGQPLRPKLKLLATEELPECSKAAALLRLNGFFQAWLGRRVGPLRDLADAAQGAELTGMARGVAYRLVENLGSLPRRDAGPGIDALSPEDRKRLARLGVRTGLMRLYMPALLKPQASEALALLWALKHGADVQVPVAGRTVLRGPEAAGEPSRLETLGYACLQGQGDEALAVRVDVLERLAANLRAAAREGTRGERGDKAQRFPFPPELAATAGLKREELRAILPVLGFTAREEEGALTLARRKPKPERRPTPQERKAKAMRGHRQDSGHNPFAALAGLKLAAKVAP